jgi:hypothetical protein
MTRLVAARFGSALAWLAGALALLAAPDASAESASFQVLPECGSEPEFRAELVRLVGADADRAFPASLVIRRDEAGEGFVLALEVGGRARELVHADCRVLFRSALVIAAASVRSQPAEPAPAAPPPAAPPPPAPPPAPSTDGPRWRGSAAIGAGLALGVLPGAAGAFEVRGGLANGRFGASLAARYLPPRFVEAEGRGVDIQGLGFRLAASFELIPELVLSAGVDADWLSGSGITGITRPQTDSAWAVAPSLELALIPFQTAHLALELAVEGRLAMQRPTFEVTGFRPVYELPNWGMFALARGVWRFP